MVINTNRVGVVSGCTIVIRLCFAALSVKRDAERHATDFRSESIDIQTQST